MDCAERLRRTTPLSQAKAEYLCEAVQAAFPECFDEMLEAISTLWCHGLEVSPRELRGAILPGEGNTKAVAESITRQIDERVKRRG